MKNGRYKLGDFGLVTPVTVVGPGADVEEGDSRYMSMELLNDDDHSDLTKVQDSKIGCLPVPPPPPRAGKNLISYLTPPPFASTLVKNQCNAISIGAFGVK